MDTTRIINLTKQQGKTLVYICKLIGRAGNYLNEVKNKGLTMPEEYLQTIAADLGTTPEYLRGETDIVTPPRDTDGLTSDNLADVTIDEDMIVFHRDGKTTKIKMPSDRIAAIEKIAQVLADGGNTDDL
jgi:transcriptional regulator with XRE-family HTH domain